MMKITITIIMTGDYDGGNDSDVKTDNERCEMVAMTKTLKSVEYNNSNNNYN